MRIPKLGKSLGSHFSSGARLSWIWLGTALLGGILGLVGLAATSKFLREPIGAYDEGILLSGANAILHGALPYRDFYTNYPPGIFVLIAGIWRVFGVSVTSERVLGAALTLGVAASGARLAGRCIGRPFSWLALGLLPFWLSSLEVTATAWLAGLTAALLFANLGLAAWQAPSRLICALTGISWAAILCFRHELFVYVNAALFGVAILSRLLGDPRWPRPRRWSVLIWAGAPALALIAVVWGATLAANPWSRIFRDLYLDQVRQVMPARVLPLPSLLTLQRTQPALIALPAFLDAPFENAVALCFAGPVLALVAVWLRKWLRINDWRAPAALGVLTIVVLPQMLGRTDEFHAVYAVAPALISCAVLTEAVLLRNRSPAWSWLLVLMAMLLLVYPARKQFLAARQAKTVFPLSWAGGRSSGLPLLNESRSEVLEFIAAHSSPSDAIYVGTLQHRFVFTNEADLYYLADRTGATRYMQFDPGLINRPDVQQEMINQLESKRAPVVVLSSCCTRSEPNESAKQGSALLDDYIQSRYAVVQQTGPYQLLLRRPF